jgi:hypothetical protein
MSAHDEGVYINLKYFVPVYDDRIDPTVREGVQLSAYTDIADASITQPYGEILWKQTNGYILSNAGAYLISALTSGPPTSWITPQRALVQTNFYGTTPLSNQISADAWERNNYGDDNLYTWVVSAGLYLNGDNTKPTGVNSACYYV